MDILQILREDYTRFPAEQTYEIYSKRVYFRDPMNEFEGRDRYRQMIGWMDRWFQDIRMDLHEIEQMEQQIRTQWTLCWRLPLPWRPRLRVDGWTEIRLDEQGLICSHVDFWKCTRADLLKQVFLRGRTGS